MKSRNHDGFYQCILVAPDGLSGYESDDPTLESV